MQRDPACAAQVQVDTQASAALLASLAGVSCLLSAAALPGMALALAACCGSRAGVSAACLASAGLSWALAPLLWDWLATQYGQDARLSAFVPAVPPSTRPRRGEPAAPLPGAGPAPLCR